MKCEFLLQNDDLIENLRKYSNEKIAENKISSISYTSDKARNLLAKGLTIMLIHDTHPELQNY